MEATIKQTQKPLPPNDLPFIVVDREVEVDNVLQKPTSFHVILLNDDYTPMNFVIGVLMELFQKNYADAYAIMMEVHQLQRGIAGTYSFEVAEEKRNRVLTAAEANDFPLNCIVEKAL